MRITRKTWLAVLLAGTVAAGALAACAAPTAPTHNDCSGTQEWNKCAVARP